VPPGGGGGFPSQPAFGGGFGGASEASQAQTALILSISGAVLSLLLGWCCFPIGLIGMGLCGAGIYLSVQETNGIAEGRRDAAGASQANAAKIVGIVGIAISVLGVIAAIALNFL
jgi:hypothetical protein